MISPAQDFDRPGSSLDWSAVERVLLIRLRSIGDTVLLTPCLFALKSWRPDIKLSVLTEPLSAPLLEDHRLVDELIVARPSAGSRARLVSLLRRSRIDVAFNMHGGTTGMILAALSHARRTIGYRGHRYSWLLTDRAPDPDVILGRTTVHSVEQQLALLKWSGVPVSQNRPRLSLTVSEEASAAVRRRLSALGIGIESPRRGLAVIAPGAAFESKRWPAAGFAAVADHLKERWNLPAVLIAGPGQEAIVTEAALRSQARPQILTGLTLKELAALLGMAALFVGNDSGPMHIAAALSRPVAAVFGPSNPRVWHPWTDAAYRVVGGDPRQPIASIPASDVIGALDEVLEAALMAEEKTAER